MAKDRRSRDQKRKQKLAIRQKKSESLAYSGRKYKTEELVETSLEIETAIYEAYLMLEKRIDDATVYRAVESLVRQMRHPDWAFSKPSNEIIFDSSEEGYREDLVINCINRRLAKLDMDGKSPALEKQIGVLRTILGTIELVSSRYSRLQKFLDYIGKFLINDVGIEFSSFSPEELRARRLGNGGDITLGQD